MQDGDLEHDYFEKDLHFEAEEAYDLNKLKFITFIQALTPEVITLPSTPNGSSQAVQTSEATSFLQGLSPITFPNFSGVPSEWSHFRDMYLSLIHSR